MYTVGREGGLRSRVEKVGTRRRRQRSEGRMAAEGSMSAGRWMRSRAGEGNQGRGNQDAKGKGIKEGDTEQFYIPVYDDSGSGSEDVEAENEKEKQGTGNLGRNRRNTGSRTMKRGREEAEGSQEQVAEEESGRRIRGRGR